MPIAGLGLGGSALLGGAISGGTSLIGGILGSQAAAKASRQQMIMQEQALAQQKALFEEGLGIQQDEFKQGAAALTPYSNLGTGAGNQLADLYGIGYSNPQGTSAGGQAVMDKARGNFTNTPDYQFAFDQGLQALDRSAASRGSLLSGGQVKGAQEFGQGLASQQFSNYFNRLLSLFQVGGNAAGTFLGGAVNSGNAALNGALTSAQQQGSTLSSIGATQAAGTIGSANSLVGGIQGAGSAVAQGLVLPAYLNALHPQEAQQNPTIPGTSPQSGYQSSFGPVSQPLFGGTPYTNYQPSLADYGRAGGPV